MVQEISLLKYNTLYLLFLLLLQREIVGAPQNRPIQFAFLWFLFSPRTYNFSRNKKKQNYYPVLPTFLDIKWGFPEWSLYRHINRMTGLKPDPQVPLVRIRPTSYLKKISQKCQNLLAYFPLNIFHFINCCIILHSTRKVEGKNKSIFFFFLFSLKLHCGNSFELPHRYIFNKYLHNMFARRVQRKVSQLLTWR